MGTKFNSASKSGIMKLNSVTASFSPSPNLSFESENDPYEDETIDILPPLTLASLTGDSNFNHPTYQLNFHSTDRG
ncbi:MAG: hypothetical protein Kow0049_06330 [Stanieria sp.]